MLLAMPERDFYHDVVKQALEKDEWVITHDPLVVRVGDARLYVDLAAEKLLGATKGNHRIAVEIKSFLGASFFSEFYTAVGQYTSYSTALNLIDTARVLYLAVPLDTYDNFFTTSFIQSILATAQINLIIYNTVEAKVVQWIAAPPTAR
jgi:hypothetical protein